MSSKPEVQFGQMLSTARKHNASDVHLIARLPPAFRVNGEIVMANADPISSDELLAMAKAILSPLHYDLFERERELCISYHHDQAGRIRLSLYHRLGTPEMAIRMCNQEVRSSAELMLPPVVDTFARLVTGLVLITGPTGVGKTTTMNYLIDLINISRKGKIVTIEDPVEFEHTHRKCIVVQIEVGTDTNSFAGCLRHTLRLDPDVIVIGELRDLDTIETALIAAETGHLVMATLHTPTALGAVERIVSVFEGARHQQVQIQLAENLHGVIAQRLMPTIDKKGQLMACEVVVVTPGMRNIIREGNFHQLYNAMLTARAQGTQTMEDSLTKLYLEGLISYDTALANAPRPKELEALLQMKRSGGVR